MGHLGDRQDFVLSRGRHDGQSRTTGRVTSERLNRLDLSRRADLGPTGVELPSPSYLEKRIPLLMFAFDANQQLTFITIIDQSPMYSDV